MPLFPFRIKNMMGPGVGVLINTYYSGETWDRPTDDDLQNCTTFFFFFLPKLGGAISSGRTSTWQHAVTMYKNFTG